MIAKAEQLFPVGLYTKDGVGLFHIYIQAG